MATAGGSSRSARALRLLLLLIMALVAVEYLCGSILDASPLRTYIYTPLYNASMSTMPSTRNKPEESSKLWPKLLLVSHEPDPHIKPNVSDHYKVTPADAVEIIAKFATSVTQNDNSTSTNQVTIDVGNITRPLPICELPSDLGPIKPDIVSPPLQELESKYPELRLGGLYTPPNCTAAHRVAILVPFRDRLSHLLVFLNHMHAFLMKQQLDYGIYIIEQAGKRDFNRAKLFNAGFLESMRTSRGRWQCFMFHDIDLLPTDQRNFYSCPRQPRHMSAAIDTFNYKLFYETLFGGVSAMTTKQFVAVNGFSNRYYGWGGEDDDMASRLKRVGYHIARYKMSIARYTMLVHKKAAPNPKRFKLLSEAGKKIEKDGISTIDYNVLSVKKLHLFTLVTVNFDENS